MLHHRLPFLLINNDNNWIIIVITSIGKYRKSCYKSNVKIVQELINIYSN